METPQEEGWRVNDMSTQEGQLSILQRNQLYGPASGSDSDPARPPDGPWGRSQLRRGRDVHRTQRKRLSFCTRRARRAGGHVPCPVPEVATHTPRLDPGTPASEPAAGDLTLGGAEIWAAPRITAGYISAPAAESQLVCPTCIDSVKAFLSRSLRLPGLVDTASDEGCVDRPGQAVGSWPSTTALGAGSFPLGEAHMCLLCSRPQGAWSDFVQNQTSGTSEGLRLLLSPDTENLTWSLATLALLSERRLGTSASISGSPRTPRVGPPCSPSDRITVSPTVLANTAQGSHSAGGQLLEGSPSGL